MVITKKTLGEIAGVLDEIERDPPRSWIDAHNRLYGIGGEISRRLTTHSDRTAFGKSEVGIRALEILDRIREKNGDPDPISGAVAKANGAISVRLPKSIHAALIAEADAEGVSLNQLCLSKLCVQLRSLV